MKLIKYFFTSYLLTILLICLSLVTYAQRPVVKPDNRVSNEPKDTTIKRTDSLSLNTKSANGLSAETNYSAEDSIRYDRVNNIVYLYGNARVKYDDFELDAGYIKLDQTNSTVFAKGQTDPKTNKYRLKPILKQGAEKPVTTDSLFYNYLTKKAHIYAITTEEEPGFLHAKNFKKNQYDEGFFKNGIYTTCNLPHPHFGIHITKGIVTQKQIVTGPAYLEIEDVPLPAGIPFGFFPKTNKRTSGVMLPSFGEDGNLGFVMRDLGYYIGLNDYWDMTVQATLYSKGSYIINDRATYIKNYKYRGNLDLSYSSIRNGNGIEGTFSNKPTKDFKILWSHSQDPAANPGTNFSASVNAGTSTSARNTRASGTYDRNELTRSTLNSSISYSRSMGLFNFESSLGHSQNLFDRSITLNLPRFSLAMTRSLYPFDSKDNVGEKKWYQKLSVGPYNLTGENRISTFDSLLFKKESLNKFQNGLRHSLPVNLSLNVFNFIQVSTGGSYNEVWNFQTTRKRYGPTPNGVGRVTDTVPGFSRYHEYNISTGLSTKFYGIKNFKSGKVMAIRHVATPSVGFSYRPDFGSDRYGYYRNLDGVFLPNGQPERYSIYENSINGSPSTGRQAAMTFSIDNNIEAKVRSSKDSVNNFVKVPILQGLSFSSSYNFAADSMKLQVISFSGRTAFFKEKLGISFGGSLDPYVYDRKIHRTVDKFSVSEGKLVRLTGFFMATQFNFNSDAKKSTKDQTDKAGENLQNATPQQKQELQQVSRNPNGFVDFNVPWNISGSYSFSYSNPGDMTSIQNTVTFSGDVNVTPKWKVGYSSGLDLRLFKLQIPQFTIYRDLHCWDLSFNWTPIGPYKSYFINLKVKASILQDLKLSKRSSYNYNY